MSQPPEGWAPPQQQSYQGQPGTPASHQVPGRRRVFMWVILAINALFLVWLVSALGSGSTCEGMSGAN